jgi:hypothetical protein
LGPTVRLADVRDREIDEPAGFIDRVIGGDTSGIDEAIAKLEQDGPDTQAGDPGSDGGSVDN